jgi:hypothetical protein
MRRKALRAAMRWIGVAVDAPGVQVLRRVDKRLGHGRAVPGAFDKVRAVRVVLDAELVAAVVVDGFVAQGADRELPLLGGGVVVGGVAGEVAGRVAAVA